jgi:ribonuclease Z
VVSTIAISQQLAKAEVQSDFLASVITVEQFISQMSSRVLGCYLCLLAVAIFLALAHGQTKTAVASEPATGSSIVFLGTGMPRPQPDHLGPSTAIIVNGKAYLVDAGVGVVRQASAAYIAGTSSLKVEDLRVAFITHLHSDHTLGLPDLIFTPWIMGRTVPLELYGPAGIKKMAENIIKAYEQDIRIRINGLEGANRTGYKVNVHEINPGVVYQDANVKVTAFLVEHGSWPRAYGYRFETPHKTIVISGDTRPSKSVIDACNGCDALIHEVYSGYGGTSQKNPEEWMKYMAAFHTSAEELGIVATQARAKKLIVTHYVSLGTSDQTEMVNIIKKGFAGTVIVARDLDVIAP